MLEVSEAANRIYLLSNQHPRQWAIVRSPQGITSVYGIRAHNPLGKDWRSVWEQLEDLAHVEAAVTAQEQARLDRPDVEFDLVVDGYAFFFSGPACCALPKSISDINKPVGDEAHQA